MKYVALEYPEESMIGRKIREIRETTGISSNKNAVIHAVLNYNKKE